MKTCSKCNAVNNDNNVFCETCGNAFPIENSVPQASEFEVAAENSAPQPQYQPYPNVPPMYAMPPQFNEDMLPDEYKPVSVGKYIGYSFLFSIPFVGFIILLITAFGSSTNKSLKNYARAMLVMYAIAVVLCIVMVVLMGALGLSMMESGMDSGIMYY